MSDGAAVLVSVTRRARKPHTCEECGHSIAVGERYDESRGLWDGHWCTIRACLVCAHWRREAQSAAEYPHEGPDYGGLREWMTDEDGPLKAGWILARALDGWEGLR